MSKPISIKVSMKPYPPPKSRKERERILLDCFYEAYERAKKEIQRQNRKNITVADFEIEVGFNEIS